MIRQFPTHRFKKSTLAIATTLSMLLLVFLAVFVLRSSTSRAHVLEPDFSSVKMPSFGTKSTVYQVEVDKSNFIPNICPVEMTDGRVSSEFGMRDHPITGERKMHTGIDLAVDHGTPVIASADGQIEFAARRGGYGNLVIIDHLNGYKTRYGHLSKILVTEGDHVKRGDTIALVGSTGDSTGPHLHYEVRIIDHENPFKGLEHEPRAFMPESFETRFASENDHSSNLGSE